MIGSISQQTVAQQPVSNAFKSRMKNDGHSVLGVIATSIQLSVSYSDSEMTYKCSTM